ncbi:hypothetical protein [Mycolicibacterium sp. 018/SC-01/001]|nr:hypothetical protein [Mycolicibacterium sp. 018/SC-01/001]
MGDAVSGVDTGDEFSDHDEDAVVGHARRSFVEHDPIMRGSRSPEQWP